MAKAMTGMATRESDLDRLNMIHKNPATAYEGSDMGNPNGPRHIDVLFDVFRANVGVVVDSSGYSTGVPSASSGIPAVRCYRCGWLMAKPDVRVRVVPAEAGRLPVTQLACASCDADA